MNRPQNRSLIRQEFFNFALPVLTTPTRLSSVVQQSALSLMYETVTICCPLAAANSVWVGGASISATLMNGQEVVPGMTLPWIIVNERQLYEVQGPLVDTSCLVPELIPWKGWDVSNIYVVAVAPTTVGVILFKGSLF